MSVMEALHTSHIQACCQTSTDRVLVVGPGQQLCAEVGSGSGPHLATPSPGQPISDTLENSFLTKRNMVLETAIWQYHLHS